MGYCGPERGANPWAILASFYLQADHVLLTELKTGSKSVQYMMDILKKYYEGALLDSDFKVVALKIEIDSGPSDKFAKELLNAAEKMKWIKKSGDNYELDETGIRLANKVKR